MSEIPDADTTTHRSPPSGSPSERTESDGPIDHPTPPEADGDAALKAALEEQAARYVRLAADFDNFRKRKGQELSDRARYGAEEAVRALLPVLDNLRRAVEHLPDGLDEGFAGGITMTVRQFDEALATLGVSAVPTEGEPFDPAIHEAVVGEESELVDTDTVVLELQRGYRLHDRLIRPAMVKVAHPAAPPQAG